MKIIIVITAGILAAFAFGFINGQYHPTEEVVRSKEQVRIDDMIARPEKYLMGTVKTIDAGTAQYVEPVPVSPAELCNDHGGEWAGVSCLDKAEKQVIYECKLCTRGTEENVVNTWYYPPTWNCGKCEPKEIK